MRKITFFFLSLFLCGQVLCASCSSSSDNDGQPTKPTPTEKPDEDDNTPSSKSLKADLKRMSESSTLKMWTCAHRSNTLKGIKEGIPGNSLAAIQYAIDAKVDMIEVDARATSDGIIVNMHDANIGNMTTGSGVLANMTSTTLFQYYLKDANGQVTQHKVPTFEQVLKASKGKIYICVDVKEPALLNRIIKMVADKGMTDEVCYFISGTNHVQTIIDANPNAIPFPWVSTTDDVNQYKRFYSKSVQMVQFNISASNLTELVGTIKSAKLVGFANHLVTDDDNLLNNQDYSRLDQFIENKIEIVQTDYSDLIIPYLEREGLR